MYYIGFYHTHKLVITLFIIIYLIKTILLLSGKKQALNTFSTRFRFFEIVVSSLLLITGIILLFETSEIRPLFIAKLAVVITAIPVAIIGFKKESKIMALLSIIMLVSAYGMAEMNKRTMVKRQELAKDIIVDPSNPSYDIIAHGKALFDTQCIVCHGENGTLRMSGAKDLTVTQLSQDQVIQRINEGKMTMPPYGDDFSNEEIMAISEYVLSLKK